MKTILPDNRPNAAVLVIHSWWGLTGSFEAYGNKLANSGYLIGLADLYQGETARTEDEARSLRRRPRRRAMYRELGENLVDLRDKLGSPALPVGVVGFSMGGHWAVWLSQRPEYAIASTILYYAARGGNFSNCKASIQAHYASDDTWVTPTSRRSMERSIENAGCSYRAFDYPGTRHWFAESNRTDAFDVAAARMALTRDQEHLDRMLS